MLHPLASRPAIYSPNKKFGFDLGPAHLEAIEAVDAGKAQFAVPDAPLTLAGAEHSIIS